MRILFMGTPEFAQISLKAMVEDGRNVIGVITQPDKPKGRGYEMAMPEVKIYAIEKNIPVFQPETLKDGAIEAVERILTADKNRIITKSGRFIDYTYNL